MTLTTRSQYGLRALLYLLLHEQEQQSGFISNRRIAEDLGIPFHFLTKIMQALTNAGKLSSSRGKHGGLRLTVPAASISVLDVVEAIEGDGSLEQCVLGLDPCGDDCPCPLHSLWGPMRNKMIEAFGQTSLEALRLDLEERGLSLVDWNPEASIARTVNN